MDKNRLIATAWPYANGSLHFGHITSLIGADVLARYFRAKGDKVLFVSGSDCHGTPIQIAADEQKISPEKLAIKFHDEFKKNLIVDLNFSYDCYTTTLTDNHIKTVQEIFQKLYDKGAIYKKTDKLEYCEKCERFLPDRYVEGECPFCHFENARGDQCDQCGHLIEVSHLINAKCKLCGNTPIEKESEHFYLKISQFQNDLIKWAKESEGWRVNAKQYTVGTLQKGLPDRSITRDIGWGIPIPIQGYEDKRIYVWFEAVCGYLSASKEWANNEGENEKWREFWDDKAIHYYLHGKDNIPYHTIIWPSILLAFGGLHLPDYIFSTEYLKLEGKQFSKSRGWSILVKDFVKKFDAETLRYYLIVDGPETADSNFSWKTYQTRTNSEIIGIFANYVNRILSFAKSNFAEGVKTPAKFTEEQQEVLNKAKETFQIVGENIEKGKFRDALKQIFELAAVGNKYIDSASPWFSIKNDREKAEAEIAVALHLVKCLGTLIAPFLPRAGEVIQNSFENPDIQKDWKYLDISDSLVVATTPLYRKIEDEEIDKELTTFQEK